MNPLNHFNLVVINGHTFTTLLAKVRSLSWHISRNL